MHLSHFIYEANICNFFLNEEREMKELVCHQTAPSEEISQTIMSEFMKFRRTAKHQQCGVNCVKCISAHYFKVLAAVEKGEPVLFALPAFPGKSPNPEKVLGHLPDYAEILALKFLGSLCTRVKEYYSPGIKIILCSDGRVFSDVIGIKEIHISAYQKEIERLINVMGLSDIVTFHLDDFYTNLSFSQMRDELMKKHGQSLGYLKHKVKNGGALNANLEEQEANRLYCGITRFLCEDSTYEGQSLSRSAIQKKSRSRAYEVIRRSQAWGDFLEERFPQAVRLSIHPQGCGSKKLGIRLIGNESWITPWHGVAVKTFDGHILLKRSEAEALGAELIHDDSGNASHYQLNREQPIMMERF